MHDMRALQARLDGWTDGPYIAKHSATGASGCAVTARIYEKLDVHKVTDLVRVVVEQGLV